MLGEPIVGVELAADVNRTDDGRPVYLVLGEHHAREWPSGEIAMEFALDLAAGYGRDPRITSLLDRERVIVVPIVNPDGFQVSREDERADGRFARTAHSGLFTALQWALSGAAYGLSTGWIIALAQMGTRRP